MQPLYEDEIDKFITRCQLSGGRISKTATTKVVVFHDGNTMSICSFICVCMLRVTRIGLAVLHFGTAALRLLTWVLHIFALREKLNPLMKLKLVAGTYSWHP